MASANQPGKVKLLAITIELMTVLEPLGHEGRRQVFKKAGIPYSSYYPWKHGFYHPSASALEPLFKALGRKLTSR